jgi:hypothetical protein
MKLIILALFISILLESTITTLPLTLLVILFASVWIRKSDVFLIAFVAGVFLDVLAFKNIGWSSLYFVIFVYAIFLYQKKFEIMTLNFITIAGFIGSFGYLYIFGASNIILQSLVCAIISSFSFFVFRKTNKKIFKYA